MESTGVGGGYSGPETRGGFRGLEEEVRGGEYGGCFGYGVGWSCGWGGGQEEDVGSTVAGSV